MATHRLQHIIFRILKWTGISIGSIILLLFLLPYLFPGFVSAKIRQWARHSIRTELTFSAARLSFFKHFPSLTLTLYDVKLKGSAPYADEELIDASEISLGVDLSSIFSEVDIDKIYLEKAFINIQADPAGHANYNIYNSKPSKTPSQPADSAGASLKIQKIIIENSKVVYNDRSIPMLIDARNFNYQGSGDLSKDVFDLNTHMQIDTINFNYDSVPYFVSKKLRADLVTSINTNSLAFIFQKNDLRINDLPVQFTGRLAFMKDGYDMDFKLKSTDSDLHDMFTALPPNMVDWLSQTEVKGYGDVDASLTGKYIASANTMPDVIFNMKIRNGYISNKNAPVPVTNLFLNFQSRLPGLNTDSLKVNIDSVFFNLDKGYFSAIVNTKGLKSPWVSAKVRSSLDLAALHNAFGMAPVDLKGRFDCQLDAEGQYATKVVRTTTLRKTTVDTVISSIPHFVFASSLKDGYLKYASKPEAVRNINFVFNASCPDQDYRHLKVSLDTLNASVLSSYIHGYVHLGDVAIPATPSHVAPARTSQGFVPRPARSYPSRLGYIGRSLERPLPVDASLETVFHLSDINKVYPLEKDSMEVAGDLAVHIRTKGNYLPSAHRFPVTRAELKLSNGRVKTKYYPHPLQDIQVSATVTNTDGSIKDLDIALTPFSFMFEGQPFMVKADLKDFDNLLYNIQSRGTLDIGKISRVFGLKDYQVTGLIATDFSLRGRESDATTGHYDRLFNEGTMKMEEVKVSSELFPLPFRIHTGLFRFNQDKMWFDKLNATYGATNFTLNGWLTDVIGYMTKKGEALHGNFNLYSNDLVVDQLMAFAGKTTSDSNSVTKPQAGHDSTGVIIVPDNLAVGFHAHIGRLQYDGLEIDSFRGGVSLDSGVVHLDTTTFVLVGAPIEMNATYGSESPHSATFDYHLSAKNFDVHRAYTEIKLFRDLASSAANAQGIVSLDYKLSGRLDGNMHPVYPSLKGGGTITLSKVKVKGMKMFGEVSKQTNKDVNDPDLAGVQVKSTINNNIITIQRTKMKISLFHFRMEGQTSFDGRLNLHVRVGLPPFGIIGIPVTVIGTEDKPEVKIRHSKSGDILTETDDSEADADKAAKPVAPSPHQ
jgi:AsmA protein